MCQPGPRALHIKPVVHCSIANPQREVTLRSAGSIRIRKNYPKPTEFHSSATMSRNVLLISRRVLAMVRLSPLAHDHTLPRPRTQLIGRSAELATGHRLLLDEAVPLLTLTGPGGVGKTRLALTLALDVLPAFPDGVAFVDLARVTDPTLVLPATAAALGVTEAGARPLTKQVCAFLRQRQVLLVLDNCEHVIDAVAMLVADLTASCPVLQVLTTSRAPLRVRAEQILPIPPLPVPVRPEGGACHVVPRLRANRGGHALRPACARRRSALYPHDG